MPDQNRFGEVPPDVPPEYADAYRRGYQQAAGRHQRPSGEHAATEPAGADSPGAEPTEQLHLEDFFVEGPSAASGPAVRQPARVAEEELPFEPVPPEDELYQPEGRPRWILPALLAGLALLLIVGAYGLGRIFSEHVSATDTSSSEPSGLVMKSKGDQAGGSSHGAAKHRGGVYHGPVEAARITGATASCQSDSSVDAAGHTVDYDPKQVFDRDMTTAWRCDGSGVGQRLSLALPGRVEVGQVGMVPGYAKTDPANGADRYAENNRITKVRWTFSDGTSVVQRLDGSPHLRDMQTKRIPPTKTNRVTIEVLDSVRGPRNTIAVSEVRVGAAVGG